MLRTVSIDGFKSIYKQSIELGRVNCFIGANGVGKSNFIEAVGVIGAAASGTVDDESLLRRGVRAGLPRLYKSSFKEKNTPVHIAISVVDDYQCSYCVSLLNPLESPEPAWSYKTERLDCDGIEIVSRGVRNKKNLNEYAGLAALSIVELDPDDRAAKLMQMLQEYAIYCPNTPTLRGIVPDLQSRRPVGLSGGQLSEGFLTLRRHLEELGEEGEVVLDQVMDLVDWVADIQTTSRGESLISSKVPRTKLMLRFIDRFMKASRNELTAYDASEGALYILYIAILCLLPSSPKILAIDNFDQALNPRLLAKLTSYLSVWLAHKEDDRQLLFTAHNPALLDGLDLSDDETRLFAVERNSQGMTVFQRIVFSEKIAELNQQYPLSRLWIMGHLGAVPNV